MATLSSIHIYPVKSCAGQQVAHAAVQARGLEHDRRWMLVDPDGKFLTARQLPRLLLVSAEPLDDGLRLQAPGMPMQVLRSDHLAEAIPVEVWKSHLVARSAGRSADEWFSLYLQRPVRLVHMGPGEVRQVTSSRGKPGDEVSFADAMPLLMVSRASLEDLNQRLAVPVDMSRFRPNLVVDGVPAYDEDRWTSVRIGDVQFEVAKPCARCGLVNIDPGTGLRTEGGEPLRTLTTYRRFGDGVLFGQLLIPRSGGVVRPEDIVETQTA